jgi:predicted ATP-grasp superfamily ATP-dependent carboligase
LSGRVIVVTDGESRAALAAVRSLGAAGHRCHVVASDPHNLAGASRFAASEHVVPDAEAQPEAWAARIEAVAREVGADLVLPVTEVSIGTVFETALDTRLDVVCPPRDAYEASVDKHGLMQLAAEEGVYAPRGVLVEEPARTLQASLPSGFAYPVVMKARRSRFLVDGRWVSGDATIVHDAEELVAASGTPGFAAGALLQEFVPGHGEAIFVLAEAGRTLASFAHRRLREKPPSGGVSVLRESIAPDPTLLTGSERLISRLGFTGAAMVEFRRAPDGRAALMEINPRLWGSVQLAIDAGVDFPRLLVDQHLGLPLDPAAAQLGVRCRWLLGDLDHLLICLRRPRERAATGRGVARVIADFAGGFFDGSRDEILRRGDARPFLRELRCWHRS